MCLFEVNIFHRLICTFIKNIYLKGLVILIFGTIGYILDYHHIYLPLFIGSACSAWPFFFIGNTFRNLPILYRSSKDLMFISISFCLAAITVVYCILFDTPFLEFRENSYQGNILEIYIVSIVLVIGLLMFCKAIKWLLIVSYMGRYSIIVFGLHGIFARYAYLPFHLVGYTLTTSIQLLLIIFLCWGSIPLCKRFVPFFTAQSDLIKIRNKGR